MAVPLERLGVSPVVEASGLVDHGLDVGDLSMANTAERDRVGPGLKSLAEFRFDHCRGGIFQRAAHWTLVSRDLGELGRRFRGKGRHRLLLFSGEKADSQVNGGK